MKSLHKTLQGLTAGFILCSAVPSRAVILLANESAGTWTTNNLTISIIEGPTFDFLSFTGGVAANYGGLAGVVQDISFNNPQTHQNFDNLVYFGNGSPTYTAGALANSDDNYVVLASSGVFGEWDTLVQLSLDGGVNGDTILSVAYDDSPVNPDIFQGGPTSFSEIIATAQSPAPGGPVPEPSGGLLSMIGFGGLAFRRSRKA